MRRFGLAVLFSALTVVVSSCNAFDGQGERTYRTEVSLGRTLAFTPRRLPTNGDPASHACVRGDYSHIYQTSQGMSGDREVWLCCIPVEEILSDSFRCADSPFPALFGGTEYATIDTEPRAPDVDRAELHPGLHSGTAPGAGAGRIAPDPRSGDRHSYFCRLWSLTCLAPDIVEDCLDGRQSKGVTLAEMLGNGPLAWNAQRETWGFSN